MSVARPVHHPKSPENVQKRESGSLDSKNHWVVIKESTPLKTTSGYRHSCGRIIQGIELHLTVRDGVFPMSGGGEVESVAVPYCPKCEMKPTGGHITPNGRAVIVSGL